MVCQPQQLRKAYLWSFGVLLLNFECLLDGILVVGCHNDFSFIYLSDNVCKVSQIIEGSSLKVIDYRILISMFGSQSGFFNYVGSSH